MLVQSVLNLMLVLLDGGELGVKASMFHLLHKVTHERRMVAHVLVMEATSKEGHASSLVATRDLHIRLLLVVVKIVVLPLPTWDLLPRTL